MSNTPPLPPPNPTSTRAPYTTLQKSRQARNRPVDRSPKTSSSGQRSSLHSNIHSDINESFESREKRDQAARILESNEMLIWYSTARNESIPQTKLHFEKIVAGIEEDEDGVDWLEEYEEVVEGKGRLDVREAREGGEGSRKKRRSGGG